MPEPLTYTSTNLRAPGVTFREALLNGIAPDGGLYLPALLPKVGTDELDAMRLKPFHEIAYDVSKRFLAGELPDDVLFAVIRDAYDFPVPLERMYERKYVMRLDQGPTASFKDFAARMMGRLMQFYLQETGNRLVILTATSGDTGSAVANAFHGLENISVVVLFPEAEVTARQRKQMTTLGGNVHIIGIDGKFDDCQAMVKRAFADPVLSHLPLSSANSINIGRLIPQTFYYFYAYAELRNDEDQGIVFAVPSGNFGDMMGGSLAQGMGLPVKRFIISVNENDEFPRYLETGSYEKIEPSRNCISSAMNVGHPSNIARLVSLYGGIMNEHGEILRQADLARMRQNIYATSVSDEQTRETIRKAHAMYGSILEPHGAVGWAGLQRYLHEELCGKDDGGLYVSLETAHPAKFPEEIQSLLSIQPALPPSLAGIEEKVEVYTRMENDYSAFVALLSSTV